MAEEEEAFRGSKDRRREKIGGMRGIKNFGNLS